MWPSLTAEHLIHDLFSQSLLRSAAGEYLAQEAIEALYRPDHRTLHKLIGHLKTCRF